MLHANPVFDLGLVATAFGFGVRHGIDWDHIAALTDLAGAQHDKRRSMIAASFYAIGHAAVVFVLGFGAIVLARRLPAGVDTVMEHIVGVTLLILGVSLLWGLARQGRAFRMRSRFTLARDAVRAATRRHSRAHAHGHEHGHDHHAPAPGTQPRAAFAIGMVHGIGAETPTQILAFTAAAGAGTKTLGLLMLSAFIVGLIASNTAIALAATFGVVHASRNFALYAGVSIVTALFSVTTGALFALGQSARLPALLGG
jgi:ABC-type nickel/cobalt efflux system permease component RcnA